MWKSVGFSLAKSSKSTQWCGFYISPSQLRNRSTVLLPRASEMKDATALYAATYRLDAHQLSCIKLGKFGKYKCHQNILENMLHLWGPYNPRISEEFYYVHGMNLSCRQPWLMEWPVVFERIRSCGYSIHIPYIFPIKQGGAPPIINGL